MPGKRCALEPQRDEKAEFSWNMVEILQKNELMGVDFPSEYEGGGAGILAFVIVVEELSKVDASVGLNVAVRNWEVFPSFWQAMKSKRRNTFRAWQGVIDWLLLVSRSQRRDQMWPILDVGQ